MKRWLKVGILVALGVAMLACSGTADLENINALAITSCSMSCGDLMTCDGGKGDMKEGETVVVSYPLAKRFKEGDPNFVGQYEAGLKQLNITITLSVEDGTAKASFKAPDGTVTSVEATKDTHGVVSGVVALKTNKESPTKDYPAIESKEIEITVESIGGPVTGAEVDFNIADCFDSYCQKLDPACKK